MKIIRFMYDGAPSYGFLNGETIRKIDGDIFKYCYQTDRTVNINDVKILPPCEPTKIVAVGLNYALHADEMGDKIPDYPALFLKPSSAVIGHGDEIIYPEMSKQVDYEAELAIVIGRKAENVEESESEKYILGYTCLNDVTARDLQKVDSQWMRAKSFNTFAPIGPVISDELDPNNAKICSRLNGEVKQSSNTSNFIFKPNYLVSTISKIMTLYPGDIITTGTPSGIGAMNVGDVIEIEIDGIGTLKNTVAAPPKNTER